MAYQYEPLPNPSEFIRIAAIQSGFYDDPIRVNFTSRSLKDPEPEYEALSYAWGSDQHTSVVHVDITGQPIIPITQNLDTALRQYRLTREIRNIWIDALCIDQASLDPREKSKQVSIMGIIFSRASMVLVWLGPEDDSSNKAMDLLELIGSCIEVDNWMTGVMQPSMHCSPSNAHFADRNQTLPFGYGELTPVWGLFERAYFKRVWVRQEMALSSRGSIRCGARTMDLDCFRRSVICIRFKTFWMNAIDHSRDQSTKAFERVRELVFGACCSFSGDYSYRDLRYFLNAAECRDPRDKIFGILALLHDSDRELGIESDYSVSVENLYVMVAQRVMVQRPSLKMLEGCNLTSRSLNVPSWTPDWSTPVPSVFDTIWSACGWISSCPTIMDENQICVTGVQITQIDTSMSIQLGSYEGILRNILKLKPSIHDKEGRQLTTANFAEVLVDDIFPEWTADAYIPIRMPLNPRSTFAQVIQRIWRANCSDMTIFEREGQDENFREILEHIDRAIQGKSLCWCVNGSVGLSLPGVQRGDVVAMLLGCRFPVVLRPNLGNNTAHPQTWQFVSIAKITGLMRGQAVYRDAIPEHLRPVRHSESGENGCKIIDNKLIGFHDSETDTIKTDPARILEEFGIKVKSYQREPHRLEVLPETLRAAGIALQDFILV